MNGLSVLVLAEQPSWRFVGKQHEKFEQGHKAYSNNGNPPVFHGCVVTVALFVLDAEEVGEEYANCDEELVAVSKEALQFSGGNF